MRRSSGRFRWSPAGSGTSSRRSTTCSARRSPRRCSSRGPAAASWTGARTAASAGGGGGLGVGAGGASVDRAADGSECRWARILAFDPPDRVVFSWDISPRWTIETDQAQTSEVEVRFYAESPTRTRVELEHRHIDRHGPGWEAITDGVDGAQGWPLYLDRYAALVAKGS